MSRVWDLAGPGAALACRRARGPGGCGPTPPASACASIAAAVGRACTHGIAPCWRPVICAGGCWRGRSWGARAGSAVLPGRRPHQVFGCSRN